MGTSGKVQGACYDFNLVDKLQSKTLLMSQGVQTITRRDDTKISQSPAVTNHIGDLGGLLTGEITNDAFDLEDVTQDLYSDDFTDHAACSAQSEPSF